MPGFKDDARYSKGRKAAKVIGLMMAGAALVGCNTAEARPVETTSQLPPEPEKPSAAETIGQDTEIPHDQLNIIEQTVSIEEMDAMDIEGFAQLDVADRAAYGYNLVRSILPESEQTYNVGPLDQDQTSFYFDQGSNTRSGNLIVAALDSQYGNLAGGDVTSEQAQKLALAREYEPVKGGSTTSSVEELMEKYATASQAEHITFGRSVAANETGWISGTDGKGNPQWFKAIERVIEEDSVDQTIQVVRVTIKLDNGNEAFWYMRGAASAAHDGDLTKEFAKKAVG